MLVVELGHGSAGALKYADEDGTYAYFSALIDQVKARSGGIFLGHFYRHKRVALAKNGIVVEDSRIEGLLHQPGLHFVGREIITSDLVPQFSGKVHSVIMRNVLSCPIFFRGEKNGSHDFGDAQSSEDATLIEHLDQLLIPGGSVLSIETYTPEYAEVQYARLRNRGWEHDIHGEYHQTWTKPSDNRNTSNLGYSH